MGSCPLTPTRRWLAARRMSQSRPFTPLGMGKVAVASFSVCTKEYLP